MLHLKQRSGAPYPLPRDTWDVAQLFPLEITGGLDALYCVYLSPDLVLGAELLVVLARGGGFTPSDVPVECVFSSARAAGATAIGLCRTTRGVAAEVTAADREVLDRLRPTAAEHGVHLLDYHVLGLTSANIGAETLTPISR